MITTAISGSARLNVDSLKHISSFIGIILNIILIVQISHCMCLFPYPINWRDSASSATYLWFEVEWGIFVGTIVSNLLFLLIRSCTHHKLQLDSIPVKKQLPEVDTIIAIKDVADAFGAAWIPFFVSSFLFFQPNNVTESGYTKNQLVSILVFNMISVVCITFLVFVEWKKGPKWYTKNSPILFFTFMLLNFIIVPLANIVYFFILAFAVPGFEVKQVFIESWVIFFLIVSMSRVFEFFFVIRRSVLLDAKNYLAAQKLLAREEQELDEILIEDETA